MNNGTHIGTTPQKTVRTHILNQTQVHMCMRTHLPVYFPIEEQVATRHYAEIEGYHNIIS